MNIAIRYTKTILKGNKYLLLSVPIVALIGFVGLFVLTHSGALQQIALLSNAAEPERSYLLMQLASGRFYNESVALVLILPFLHLLFFQQLYTRPLDFNLPINPMARFWSYILTSASIFVYNWIIIILLNLLLQFYLQFNYLDEIRTRYEEFGYLYTQIPINSILFNSAIIPFISVLGLAFFAFLPIYLVGILYFKKHSRVKGLLLAICIVSISGYIGRALWNDTEIHINNKFYLQNYPFLIVFIISILFYSAFFQLIKNKEV